MADCRWCINCGYRPIDHTHCGQPAVAVIEIGCVHEHLDTSPTCAEHLAVWEAGARDWPWRCTKCWDSAEPHFCYPTTNVRYLEESREQLLRD